jgi:hypothetical protein
VEELEGQIKALSSHEFQELRAWLAEYDAEIWDRQFKFGRACRQAGRCRRSGAEGFFGGPVYGPVRHRASPSFWQE